MLCLPQTLKAQPLAQGSDVLLGNRDPTTRPTNGEDAMGTRLDLSAGLGTTDIPLLPSQPQGKQC